MRKKAKKKQPNHTQSIRNAKKNDPKTKQQRKNQSTQAPQRPSIYEQRNTGKFLLAKYAHTETQKNGDEKKSKIKDPKRKGAWGV